jgi:hypothetical protein
VAPEVPRGLGAVFISKYLLRNQGRIEEHRDYGSYQITTVIKNRWWEVPPQIHGDESYAGEG